MLKFEDVKVRVVDALRTVSTDSVGQSDTGWTYEIKRKVSILGIKLGYYTCANKLKKPYVSYPSEWLFDLCWLDYSHEKEPLKRTLYEMPLVLESEWRTDKHEILNDFEKLFVANAGIRVFIFQDWHNQFEVQKAMLLRCIRETRLAPAGSFIIACYRKHDEWAPKIFDGAGNDL